MRFKQPRLSRGNMRQSVRKLRPNLDAFENRILLSGTYTVTNTADSGFGSLRDAITTANAGNASTIVFDLPTNAALSIAPATPLPAISNSVVIDATTQPGYTNKPIVQLDGEFAGNANGLEIDAGNVVVKGLVINNFAMNGIQINGYSNNKISDDYLGTDLSGTNAAPNGYNGIFINGSTANTIGGVSYTSRDVISGNLLNGIEIDGPNASSNQILGDFIGTDNTAGVTLPNGGDGILLLNAPQTIVGGLQSSAHNVVSGNFGDGIHVESGSNNTLIQGNYIGASDAGNGSTTFEFLGNFGNGIEINGASGVSVGGAVAGSSNVISANDGNGIEVAGPNALVQGNYIGTNVSGTTIWDITSLDGLETVFEVGNVLSGIDVNGVSGTTIGGTTPLARNIISGNFVGISLTNNLTTNVGANSNLIEGNYIGTDVTGSINLGQGSDGIEILDSSNNTIGGTTAGEANVVSGNGNIEAPFPGFSSPELFVANGVSITSDANGSASGNVISGNYIGTDATGSYAIGNTYNGILVVNSGSNVIGGTVAGAGNVISGNYNSLALTPTPGYGIAFQQAGSVGNLIAGNVIGLNAAGTAAVSNNSDGINIDNGVNTTIGGTTAVDRNLISGNLGAGIDLTDGTNGTLIVGNYIGTDVTSIQPIGNTGNGILLNNATDNQIGGAAPGDSNVISATVTDTSISSFFYIGDFNTAANGIQIAGTGSSSNQIQGNFIGTDSTGTIAVGNIGFGIVIDGASHNFIGGVLPGDQNIISGNGFTPLSVPNSNFYDPYENIPLVTTLAGFSSENPGGGVLIVGSGAAGNSLEGNMIGVNASGTAAIPNFYSGVTIANAPDNQVGGLTPAARNIISGNDFNGVEIMGQEASLNFVEGNYIGTDSAGLHAIGNGNDGVIIDVETRLVFLDFQITYYSSPRNTIGGSLAGAGNLISGNLGTGVVLDGSAGNANQDAIQGNYIGTDFTGTHKLKNLADGIDVIDSVQPTIGGTVAAAGNIIAGSGGDGLNLSGSAMLSPVVQGNWIGTDPNGDAGLGNYLDGIRLTNVSGATIGGETSGQGNVVADNGQTGVAIIFGSQDLISANSIYGNANLGIDLGGSGTFLPNHTGSSQAPNNGQNFPVVTSAVSNATTGTTIEASLNAAPNQTYTIEFFSSPTYDHSTYGQGQVYLGSTSVTTDKNGNDNFFLANFPNMVVSGGQYISAVAIDSKNNTSEFSQVHQLLGSTTPQADLGISLTATPATGVVNDNLIYTVSITNNGPLTATGVSASFPIPAGTKLVDVLTNLGTYTLSTNMLTFTIASIAPGVTTDATVTLLPTSSGTINASASVMGLRPDYNSTNNTTSLSTTILQSATSDVSVGITTSDPTPWLNSNIVYSLTISNAGPTDATGVMLTNLLPTGVTLGAISTPQGTYSSLGGQTTFALWKPRRQPNADDHDCRRCLGRRGSHGYSQRVFECDRPEFGEQLGHGANHNRWAWSVQLLIGGLLDQQHCGSGDGHGRPRRRGRRPCLGPILSWRRIGHFGSGLQPRLRNAQLRRRSDSRLVLLPGHRQQERERKLHRWTNTEFADELRDLGLAGVFSGNHRREPSSNDRNRFEWDGLQRLRGNGFQRNGFVRVGFQRFERISWRLDHGWPCQPESFVHHHLYL